MHRILATLLVTLGLAVACAVAFAATRAPSDQGRIYSVAAVDAHLTDSARTWVGRTILVQGMAAEEPAYHPSPNLVDASADATIAPLPLAWAGLDPLRAGCSPERKPCTGMLSPSTVSGSRLRPRTRA
jgi:hypothetical protein